MTGAPFRNGQTLPTNLRERASQEDGLAFDLEKYGPCIDKIRALFAPTLEHRLRSLLEEFVYKADSRLAGQFPRFKKLVDAMADAWKGPLNRAAEYDVETIVNATIENAVERMTRSNLLNRLLDSVVLHRRLDRICRELDDLGIEDDVLRGLNAWLFANVADCRSRACFAYVRPVLAAIKHKVECIEPFSVTVERRDSRFPRPLTKSPDRAAEYSSASCDARGSAGSCECRPVVRSAMNRDERRNGRARHPRRVSDTRDRLPRWQEEERDSAGSTCDGMAGSRDDNASEYRDDRAPRESTRLRMIIRRMHDLENRGCATRAVTARLPVPCRPCDLIGRIFVAEPSLVESCLIVMRRRFEAGLYNACSCFNDALGRSNDRRSLRLDCDIRPGYIGLKLMRIGGGCLYVSRVPICQHVRRPTRRRDLSSACSAPSTTVIEKELRSARREGNDNDTLARIEERSGERTDDTCRSNRSRTTDTAIGASRGETDKDAEEAATTPPINENVSQRDPAGESDCCRSAICFCNDESVENVIETIADTTLRNDRPEGENEDDHAASAKRRENGSDLDPIATNDERTTERPVNSAEDRTTCPFYGNVDGGTTCEDVLVDEDASGCWLPAEAHGERDRVRRSSSSEESNADGGGCCSNACSIATFARGSERGDKQPVELHCSRFADNGVGGVAGVGDDGTANGDTFDSARVEVGCDSTCSFCRDDDRVVDVTIVDDASDERPSVATRSRNAIRDSRGVSSRNNNDDSLTTSVQTSRLRVSSKGINVDVSYRPRTVIWLASGDDGGRDVKRKEEFRTRASTVARRGIEVGKEVDLHVIDGTRTLARRSAARRSSVDPTGSDERVATSEAHSRARVYYSSSRCPRRTLARNEESTDGQSRGPPRWSRASSSDDVRSATSTVTVVRRSRTTTRGRRNDRVAGARPAFAGFRNSVDRIKRLLPAKLARMLFDDRSSGARELRLGEELAECITRREANGRYNGREDCRAISCTGSDCRGRGRVALSRGEFAKIASIRGKNRREERSASGSSCCERRPAGDSEVPSSPPRRRSTTETLTWSCDSPTLVDSCGESNGERRCLATRAIESERGPRCSRLRERHEDHDVIVSSRSTEVSLAENDRRHLERYTCVGPRDGVFYERSRNADRGRIDEECERRLDHGERGKCRPIVRYASDNSEDFSVTSFETLPISSSAWTGEARDVRKGSGSASGNATRFPLLGRQVPEDTLDYERTRKRWIRQDRAYDLNLDLRSQLSRYVRLCRNVKRSLMRTLQPDDVYEISARSSTTDIAT